MSKFKSEFLQIMEERGFLYQCTDEKGLDELFRQGPVTAYIGFDCTAPSLHVGSLIQIMVLRWLQKTKNKPIILIGGATTKIGDPSGKDESRKLLLDEEIDKNISGIKNIFGQFGVKAQFVNNEDWLANINHIDFLRDYGRHFSINRMLSMDSVKNRIEREQELSFLEFNYMVMQSYDFVHLFRKYGCRLQIGGSDQWGNIVNGTELWRRVNAGNKPSENLFGLTTPLITTASGAKMGKTAEGAVWLSANMLKPYDYWQFWRNTEDADVGRFLRLFTELPMEEVKKLEKLQGADINKAKIILANEATTICHGAEAAKLAEQTAQKTFAEGGVGENLPTINKSKKEISDGIDYISLFVEAGLAESRGAAKKLIQGGGARKNGEKIENIDSKTSKADISSGIIKLSSGKKNHAIVKAV